MTPVSLAAPKWAVSGRTHGEVLTAGVSTPGLEVVLLGVPEGFTPLEVEGWLRDLSGVAGETSRGDDRERAIPALLHHALTGLLFSQSELWGRAAASPLSAAFVESDQGCAFGWVGEGAIQVIVDGVPTEPRWVLVRDESGNEAHATVFPAGRNVVVTLDWWPQGDDGSEAPASIEAVFAPESVTEQAYVPALDPALESAPAEATIAQEQAAPEEPQAVASAEPVVEAPAELPSHLTLSDQPGLATAPVAAEPEPVVHEAPAPELAPSPEPPVIAEAEAITSAVQPEPPASDAVAAELEPQPPAASIEESPAPAQGAHPVGRWLARMLGFGRSSAPAPRMSSAAPDSEATPLSTYDSLLSDAVPAAEPAPDAEQTHLELASLPIAAAEPEANAAPAEAVPAAVSEAPPVFHDAHEYDETFALPDATIAAVIAGAHEDERVAALAAESAPQLAEAPAAEVAPEPMRMEPVAQEPVAPEPAAPEVVQAPVAEAATTDTLRPVGLAEVLGAAFAPPAPEPEPEPMVEPPAFTHADLLRALSESPLASRAASALVAPPAPSAPLDIVREPVGAAEDFAIAPLPGHAAPVVTPSPLAATPPAVPFELRPHESAPEAPVAPPTLRTPEAPPVLHVHVASASAPPMLRVESAAAPPTAPPVLRVAPQPTPPPVIVPTPPVAPVAPVAGFAPSAAPSAPPASSAPDAAEAAEPAQAEAPTAPPRIEWPKFEERELEPRKWYRRRPVLGAIIVALFAAGWLLGTFANPRTDEPGPFARALRAVGLGGPRFELSVDSSPPGAWIAVDGKDVARRTPSRLELKPGAHEITLSLPDLGSAKFPVKGENGAQVKLAPTLAGALQVTPSDPNVPITVALDGRSLGYAPVALESVAPGLHEVQFSGPGMAPWAQNIHVRIGQTAQVVARPMTAPGTGVLQVQATLNDEEGVSPLSGAQVFVDGAARGVTPLSLELPRGPHSVKVTWHGETAAIQVIDLPGGNQRIASFDFGLDQAAPQINIVGSSRTMSAAGTNMVSAAFAGLAPRDLREAWLHVRSAEGLWRRYPMTPVTSPGATMMAAVFPSGVYDASGRTIWYVSAIAVQGDEYFSEMQPALLEGAKPAAKPKPAATPAPAP